MKIIQPSFEILEQEDNYDGICRQIERAGRTCYKSEDKITDTSAPQFVDRMIASRHYAMLEHGTVYLFTYDRKTIDKYAHNPYSRVVVEDDNDKSFPRGYITTNMRVIVENNWHYDLKNVVPAMSKHIKRVTVLFHTQVSITREFNRHRVNSVAESSTRYCNYSKDKFGNEISVNKPEWVNRTKVPTKSFETMCCDIWNKDTSNYTPIDYWWFANLAAEYAYMSMVKLGLKAQDARCVLPLDLNTDLVHTAFVDDWYHFFELRAVGSTGAPHPDAAALAIPLYNEFIKMGLL